MRALHSHVWTHDVEPFRLQDPRYPWTNSRQGDPFGAFLFASGLRVIFSCDLGWEHASVSLPERCPTWEEMCFIKDLFWKEDEVVIQYHPRKADYVNHHPFCLHLWKPTNVTLPTPHPILVGPMKEPPPEQPHQEDEI